MEENRDGHSKLEELEEEIEEVRNKIDFILERKGLMYLFEEEEME